jgi:putative DNA methylase
LANTTRRSVWLNVTGQPGRVDIELRDGSPPKGLDVEAGTVRASSVTCPACGTSAIARDVRDYGKRIGLGRRLYAVLDITEGVRLYRPPRSDEVEGAEMLATAMLDELDETPDGTSPLPDEQIDEIAFRELKNLVYGFDSWRSLFNQRQLYVLGVLCAAVRASYDEMILDGMDEERALAIATYLGLCVDRVADRNSSFCGWDVGRETVRNTFPRQALAMTWDYTEIDPLRGSSGGWSSAVRWIERAIRHCSSTGATPARVLRGNAQHLAFQDKTFDAVIIDPPYYFSIHYSDLSNFFYVWLKRSVGHLHPGLFLTPLTPKDQEVIQNRANPHHPRYISAEEFERRLERSLREAARVVKSTGIVSIVFAHTDVVAWERLLRALQRVRLVVSTSWPMRSEMSNRPLAQVKAALGSSVVLVCRPQRSEQEGFYDDVVRALEARIAQRLDAFEEMGLVGADYFVSAIGPAFEVFAQYSRIARLSGDEVDVAELMVLARQAVARHAMRRLLGADSLASLDAESLFYLTWRWAYLTAAIPADEAYKLEKAFDIDLGGLVRPGGFAHQAGSNFSLLGPHERKGLKLSPSPPLVDVLHLACQLWDAGRRRELEELLGATGMGVEPSFWAAARALAEIVPDGNRERTMLLGLTGNRDVLSQAAARSTASVEELTLFSPDKEVQ